MHKSNCRRRSSVIVAQQSDSEVSEISVKTGFGKVLNSHGYGFHYSVLREASELFANESSKWAFEAAEFPVEVQGRGTRIDFVLQHRDHPSFYLLAECKRANPALSNWCFARAPLVRRNRSEEPMFLEHFRISETGTVSQGIEASSRKVRNLNEREAYHIGIEVKSGKKGDSNGQGRGHIEDAVTQVCRGIGGMVDMFLSGRLKTSGKPTSVYLLPVVFTTAHIWTSDVDLSTADLQTGELDFSSTEFAAKDYIFYQYHMSPGLKHSYNWTGLRPDDIGSFMDSEYIRTVSIVSASGIGQFLSWSSNINVDFQ
jgi:hypothetical protein